MAMGEDRVAAFEREFARRLEAANSLSDEPRADDCELLRREHADLKARYSNLQALHAQTLARLDEVSAIVRESNPSSTAQPRSLRSPAEQIHFNVVSGLGGDFVDACPLAPGKVIRFEADSRPAYHSTAIECLVPLTYDTLSDLEIQFYLVGGDRHEGRCCGPMLRGNQFVDCNGAPIRVPWPLSQGRPLTVGSLERLAVEVRHRGLAHRLDSVIVSVAIAPFIPIPTRDLAATLRTMMQAKVAVRGDGTPAVSQGDQGDDAERFDGPTILRAYCQAQLLEIPVGDRGTRAAIDLLTAIPQCSRLGWADMTVSAPELFRMLEDAELLKDRPAASVMNAALRLVASVCPLVTQKSARCWSVWFSRACDPDHALGASIREAVTPAMLRSSLKRGESGASSGSINPSAPIFAAGSSSAPSGRPTDIATIPSLR